MIKLTLVALTVAKAAAQVMTYENAPADGLTQGKAEKIWGSYIYGEPFIRCIN